MLRAALPLVPGVELVPGLGRWGVAKPAAADATLPDLALVRHDVAVDAAHVRRYAEVCGFPRKDVLPATYPHVLAFPLHLAIMTDRAFPFPAVGTLHLENSLTQHRPLLPTETFQITVRPTGLRPHPKGRVFDLVTTVHVRGELAWEETSTLLRRGAGEPGSPAGTTLPEVPAGTTRWRLGGDLGRRYAAASADYNPIHLHPLTAKAFGFPRQIAHGMWTAAHALAALQGRLPTAFTYDVAFGKPLLLPSTVELRTRPADGGWDVEVR